LSPKIRFQTTAAYNYYYRIKNTFFRDLTTLSSELAQDQDSARFDLWMFRGFISPKQDSLRWDYQLGIDLNHERGTGARLVDLEQFQGDYAGFGSLTYRFSPRFRTRLGLRYGYNTKYRAPVTPAFHVWARLSESLVLRASTARGFRAPSLKELHFFFVDINHNIQGNPDLKAEYSNHYQLSLELRKLSGEHFLKARADAFYNQMQNLISLVQVDAATGLFSYQNVARFQSVGGGGEVNWKYRTLQVGLGARYTGRYNQLSEDFSEAATFSFAPEASLQVQWKESNSGILFAGFYKYTGALPGLALDDTELVQTEIAAYHTADLSLSRGFWKDRITFRAGAKNLLNVTQINSTAVGSGGVHTPVGGQLPVAWGRTWFAQLRFNFSNP
ncbi:MAG: TonB-dependent receptor, partial [Bacteroidota bacterium]